MTLELHGVDVTYGAGRSALTAAKDVALTIPDGGTVGLVGESGSGKSTVARAIVGLAPVTAGRIVLDGADITNVRGRLANKSLRKRVQMIFQDPYSSLNPRMTVGEAIDEAIALHRPLPRRRRPDEIARLLAMVNLDAAVASRYPHQFSGGQRQRIAIARALAVEPDVIIADEITSAVDVSVQASVLNLIREIQQQTNLSMLFISHNLAVVRYVSDQVLVMHLGQIVETARRDELFHSPSHPYTRVLLDSLPSMSHRATADESVRSAAHGDVPDPHDPPPGCRFHTRCPYGPLVFPERTVCADVDPHGLAGPRRRAACHFPLVSDLSSPSSHQGALS